MKTNRRKRLAFLVLLCCIFMGIKVYSKVFSKIFKHVKNPIFKQLNRVNEIAQKTVLRSEVSLNERVLYNFGVVRKKQLYRSAQLPADVLDHYMKYFNIKTVINLRGQHPEEAWWRDEKAVVERNGGTLFNISLNADRLTSKSKLLKLLEIYDTAPRPILIHCLGGVDRTGEAAALWVLEKQKKSKKRAAEQFSLFPYRHSTSKHPAKRFLIKIWQGRTWLKNDYDPRHYPEFIADVD